MPRISISVAKNGPAEKAGSILSRLSKTGIQLPSATEIITIIANVTLTAKLLNKVELGLNCMRIKPVMPSVAAMASAIKSSRFKNLWKLAEVISPPAKP